MRNLKGENDTISHPAGMAGVQSTCVEASPQNRQVDGGVHADWIWISGLLPSSSAEHHRRRFESSTSIASSGFSGYILTHLTKCG
jgi:hypothetical protein